MVPNDTRVILYRSMWFDPLPVIVSVLILLCVIFTLYIFWIINTFILINEDIYKCLSFAILYSQNNSNRNPRCFMCVLCDCMWHVCCMWHVRSVLCNCNTDSVPYDVFLYDTFCSVRHVRSVLCSTCSVRNPSVIPRQGTTGDRKECLCLTWE